MNILFFLKPKNEVVYISSTISVQHALTDMQNHTFTAVPIISADGDYIGTITEGDFLRYFKDLTNGVPNPDPDANISSIPRSVSYDPISINADIEDLISKVINQNFVPVIDDNHKFIGIITRKDVIQYIYNKLKSLQ